MNRIVNALHAGIEPVLGVLAVIVGIVVHVLERLGYRPIGRTIDVTSKAASQAGETAAWAWEQERQPWHVRTMLIILLAFALVLSSLLLIRPAACAAEIQPSPTPLPTPLTTPTPFVSPTPLPTIEPGATPFDYAGTPSPFGTLYPSNVHSITDAAAFVQRVWLNRGYGTLTTEQAAAIVQGTRPPTPTPTPLPTLRPTVRPTALGTPGPSVAPRLTTLAYPTSPRGYISCYFSTSHPALDIAVYCGAKILAGSDGVITYEGWTSDGGGVSVIMKETVQGAPSWTLRYAHMQSTAVDSGQHVTRGQLIGYVGATGRATGCHVHFQVTVAGAFVNPLPLIS